MKIATIIGARPQFIKAAAVSRAIAAHNCLTPHSSRLTEVIIHTGQHYDNGMSAVFFEELEIPDPKYNLAIGSGSHGQQTGQMLAKIEEVLIEECPDWVLVYGDTNSTLAGALTAAKLHIPVAHVEAGLRSYNRRMPEEINRVLTDHISTILFCPSKTAIENLRKEGFTNIHNNGNLNNITRTPHSSPLTPDAPLTPYSSPLAPNASRPTPNASLVLNVGDVMYDMLLYAVRYAENKSRILDELKIVPRGYDMLTLHRAETTDDPRRLEEIISFVNEVSARMPVIFPMHPRMAKAYAGIRRPFAENVRIIEPLGYFDLLTALKNAHRLMTDSGGMQKEAYWLQVPCITLRDETEWVETIHSGWNILWRDYRGAHHPPHSSRFTPNSSLLTPHAYGDGHAAEKIIAALRVRSQELGERGKSEESAS